MKTKRILKIILEIIMILGTMSAVCLVGTGFAAIWETFTPDILEKLALSLTLSLVFLGILGVLLCQYINENY